MMTFLGKYGQSERGERGERGAEALGSRLVAADKVGSRVWSS